MKNKTKKPSRKTADGKLGIDAMELLTKDHKTVKEIFKKHYSLVEDGGSRKEKLALVKEACKALTIHAQIEEEIFYPALEGIVDGKVLAEAFVEHSCAKNLIKELQDMDDSDVLFDAKFVVLGELVKHHIEEEETDIFPKAQKSKLDLNALGTQMEEMKETLENELSFPHLPIPREGAPAYI
jgi:hemerythrin superfamily protein